MRKTVYSVFAARKPKFGNGFFIIAFSLVLTSQASVAQVYKYEDADGNIVYSDSPPEQDPGLEPANLPDIITQPSVPVPDRSQSQSEEPGEIDVTIDSPQNETVILNNQTGFIVSATASRGLAEGELATLMVNGEAYATSQSTLSWEVTDLIRGEYRLQILISHEGEALASSNAVTVFVQRNIARAN